MNIKSNKYTIKIKFQIKDGLDRSFVREIILNDLEIEDINNNKELDFYTNHIKALRKIRNYNYSNFRYFNIKLKFDMEDDEVVDLYNKFYNSKLWIKYKNISNTLYNHTEEKYEEKNIDLKILKWDEKFNDQFCNGLLYYPY